ncbi:hypothetical protein M0R45_019127 [Rubus argutus]|uniref:Uncharacterized protein n=1 Tax=Rubus argutus TaxID=59490 RepID=A0AAW1X6X4_RUBAR
MYQIRQSCTFRISIDHNDKMFRNGVCWAAASKTSSPPASGLHLKALASGSPEAASAYKSLQDGHPGRVSRTVAQRNETLGCRSGGDFGSGSGPGSEMRS